MLQSLEKEVSSTKMTLNNTVDELSKKEYSTVQEFRAKIKEQQEIIRKSEDKVSSLESKLKENGDYISQQK